MIVKPPGFGRPGRKRSIHWPGENCGREVEMGFEACCGCEGGSGCEFLVQGDNRSNKIPGLGYDACEIVRL